MRAKGNTRGPESSHNSPPCRFQDRADLLRFGGCRQGNRTKRKVEQNQEAALPMASLIKKSMFHSGFRTLYPHNAKLKLSHTHTQTHTYTHTHTHTHTHTSTHIDIENWKPLNNPRSRDSFQVHVEMTTLRPHRSSGTQKLQRHSVAMRCTATHE